MPDSESREREISRRAWPAKCLPDYLGNFACPSDGPVANRMIVKGYSGWACRTVCGRDAAVELQGGIYRVSCKPIPDTPGILAPGMAEFHR